MPGKPYNILTSGMVSNVPPQDKQKVYVPFTKVRS